LVEIIAVASWFETREDALLTMRVWRPHPRVSAIALIAGGGRNAAASKDEASEV
jgi:hypothetical protein